MRNQTIFDKIKDTKSNDFDAILDIFHNEVDGFAFLWASGNFHDAIQSFVLAKNRILPGSILDKFALNRILYKSQIFDMSSKGNFEHSINLCTWLASIVNWNDYDDLNLIRAEAGKFLIKALKCNDPIVSETALEACLSICNKDDTSNVFSLNNRGELILVINNLLEKRQFPDILLDDIQFILDTIKSTEKDFIQMFKICDNSIDKIAGIFEKYRRDFDSNCFEFIDYIASEFDSFKIIRENTDIFTSDQNHAIELKLHGNVDIGAAGEFMTNINKTIKSIFHIFCDDFSLELNPISIGSGSLSVIFSMPHLEPIKLKNIIDFINAIFVEYQNNSYLDESFFNKIYGLEQINSSVINDAIKKMIIFFKFLSKRNNILSFIASSNKECELPIYSTISPKKAISTLNYLNSEKENYVSKDIELNGRLISANLETLHFKIKINNESIIGRAESKNIINGLSISGAYKFKLKKTINKTSNLIRYLLLRAIPINDDGEIFKQEVSNMQLPYAPIERIIKLLKLIQSESDVAPSIFNARSERTIEYIFSASKLLGFLNHNNELTSLGSFVADPKLGQKINYIIASTIDKDLDIIKHWKAFEGVSNLTETNTDNLKKFLDEFRIGSVSVRNQRLGILKDWIEFAKNHL